MFSPDSRKKEQLPLVLSRALLLAVIACVVGIGRLAPASDAGTRSAALREIAPLVEQAIEKGDCPGAVVYISHQFRPIYFRAFGNRQLEPEVERMTRDTVFDMASLTKVMATATAVMVLVDEGKVDLHAPVAQYLPEFGQNGKEGVTVEQLLRHRGGLIPDNPIGDYENGPAEAWKRICELKPIYSPGTRFRYTDVGYIVLGKLIERVSGQSLDEFARERIYRPLGMEDTTFNPPVSLRSRCAPCDRRNGDWIRGVVHDPRAFLLGGVAGHAGLFSTASDTAIFAHMIVNGGEWNGVRVLSREAVRLMTDPGDTPPGQERGLGWDIDTGYSGPRGELFPRSSFGHTGFTGTSLWIDPASQTVVILLTNRLHPDGRGDVRWLRRQLGTIAARAVGYADG